jgi:hypothetical protein
MVLSLSGVSFTNYYFSLSLVILGNNQNGEEASRQKEVEKGK